MPRTETHRDSITNTFDPYNGWSEDIENVCEAIRGNSYAMSDKHKKLYIYYKGQLKYYKIPVIIISGLNSVIAVGLQPYLEQGIISGSNCLLALLCGIIGSIELFLGIQTSMETEMAASKNFYLLSVNIFKVLSLERHRRPHTGKEYLEEVYSEYSKLFESSALLNTKVVDKLSNIPMQYVTNTPVSSISGSPRQFISGSLFNSKPNTRMDVKIPDYDSPEGSDLEIGKMIDPKTFTSIGLKNMLPADKIMKEGVKIINGGGILSDMVDVHTNMKITSNALQKGANMKISNTINKTENILSNTLTAIEIENNKIVNSFIQELEE